MKILVVSDTHGRDTVLREVLKKVKPIDMLIHCGDSEGSEEYIRRYDRMSRLYGGWK